MGSLKRKKQTRPLPLSAKVRTVKGKLVATWEGRRGVELTSVVKVHEDGRKTVSVLSDVYYAKYTDVDGVERIVSTGCKDKSRADRVLKNLEDEQERIRAGVVSKEEHGRSKLADTPLPQHIADFHRAHNVKPKHRRETKGYLDKLAAFLGWEKLGDMKRSDFEGWAADQTRAGMSARTRNGYQTALITFCNWLERDGRILRNPFARLRKANEEADRRRARRAYTEDEYRRLIESTRQAKGRRPAKANTPDGRPKVRMTAQERADLYIVLFRTGIRIGELGNLSFRDVVLTDEQPRIEIPENVAKNKRTRVVPLRPEVKAILEARPGAADPASPLFEIPGSINRRLDADLKRAGLEKYDSRGRQLDLHAMRKTFGTWMAMAGANPRVLQAIMGHRDINLTFRLYVDIGVKDAFEAIAKLPSLTMGEK